MINCVFEDNGKGSFRHVTVGIIVVNIKGEALLVKRAPNIWNGNKYTIPGGFLARDEDTKQGVLRELLEETGFTGGNLTLFRVNDNPNRPKEDRQNLDIIYFVDNVSGDMHVDKEGASIEWYKEDDLPNDDAFAFDHRDSIVRYFAYRKNPSVMKLPIIG